MKLYIFLKAKKEEEKEEEEENEKNIKKGENQKKLANGL